MTSSSAHAPPPEPNADSARLMWEAYLASHPEHADEQPQSSYFGDSAALADELVQLVSHGPKRATAGLAAEFAHDREPLPRIGDHWVMHDGAGDPVVVLRTVELRLGRLDSVDAQFAWDEGEDDRTLESWLGEHRRYFRRSCERMDLDFSDGLEVVFERFRVVWPPQHADS